MSTTTQATRAMAFQRHCRSGLTTHRPNLPIYRHASSSSSSSPYSPSNFTRQFPSNRKGTNNSSSHSHTLGAPRPTWAHPRASRGMPMDIPGSKLTFWVWVKTLFGHVPKSNFKPAPFHVNNNPYRARKQWPPDFRELDPKRQFHFEKTYRRRAALKWARPTWNKSIKILQQTMITMTILYFVFFLEPAHGEGTPFDGFRVWFFDKMKNLGQLPESTRYEAEKLSDEAKSKLKKSDSEEIESSPVAKA
ncbi:hypothetical protein PV10_01485 [Exophiala mesophila]|uniref:Uncharacterized protein n=1 Tax=Exophiala mesophila TaxID=212818 RepID=A0A0D1ZT64_EXOME|nr:uncharacterized protein PV10_01485 [Exophiala mesophila]KIV97777.1 hypothetical protein PV10_01485 [Exophiala mesophila]